MSAAIVLVVLKYGYLFVERKVVYRGRPGDERGLPLVRGLRDAPSFAMPLTSKSYGGHGFRPLWCARGHDDRRRRRVLHRAQRHSKALKPINREPSDEFYRRLTFATSIASLLFAPFLPLLLVGFYHRVAIAFFCVVYGFMLAVHLVRVALAHSLSAARADDRL